MTKQELVTAAATAMKTRWSSDALEVVHQGANSSLAPQLLFHIDSNPYAFQVQVKQHINTAGAARIAKTLNDEQRQQYLLVAEYIRPNVAHILREGRVNYADSVGNCHIERPPLFLHVEHQKLKRAAEKEPIRAFKGEGLKVIFAFLLQPEMASRSYRDLVELAGASQGVVQYTIGDLERLGFIERVSRTKRHLRNPLPLLDRWATAYREHLRPKLSMGSFRYMPADRFSQWEETELPPGRDHWGGEPAAALLTNYLKPERLTIYSRANRAELMKRHRIVPDDDGPVEVLRSFWPEHLEQELEDQFANQAVPNILTYADLLSTKDPRNADVAAQLQQWFIEEMGRD